MLFYNEITMIFFKDMINNFLNSTCILQIFWK